MSVSSDEDQDQQTLSAKDFSYTLNSGNKIPMVGFGTSHISGFKQTLEVLDYALEAGYRLIDTAAMYGNEGDIGKALKQLLPKHKLDREDVFITTKLHNSGYRKPKATPWNLYDKELKERQGIMPTRYGSEAEIETFADDPEDQGQKATRALQKSLEKLDCEYIDLYLINWPGSYGVSSSSKENSALREKSWEHMVKAVNEGLVKNIGVSSYTVKHLKQLLNNNHGIKPCVNQVEWHPLCYQKKLYEFCTKNGIMIQAYQSLGDTVSDDMDLLKHPTVVNISNKLEKSSAQVLLRWALQLNVGVLPKSETKDHIISNMELNFKIPPADMKTLCGFKKQIRFDWNPEDVA